MTYRKKLIEVALPLEAINVASAREKSIRHGHPSTLHLWWARRPLAAARAVIFASLVDDPDSPDAPPAFVEACKKLNGKDFDYENKNVNANGDTPRMRLFDFIEKLVTWEATTDEKVLNKARELIMIATEGNPPPLLDPFAGGGSIPLEAQRLGLEAHASDLNPVAVMINKAQIEIPPRFANMPPVNPRDRAQMFAPTPDPSPKMREGNEDVDKWDISPELERRMQAVARDLRNNPTKAENVLWQAIRKKQLDGRKFRRQVAIGAFVVDFYCSSERLAVEVDGPIHDDQKEADQLRQTLIESLGIRFVRLTNAEVEQDLDGALNTIRAAFLPPPNLPQNEGGNAPSLHVGEGAGGWGDETPTPDISSKTKQGDSLWRGAAGLAADVRYYGEWMREQAWEKIGHLYPQYIPPSQTLPPQGEKGLKAQANSPLPAVGEGPGVRGETVIAWLWARTVKSPNPAVDAHVPLVRSFILSKKKGRECWAKPVIDGQTVRFEVTKGKPPKDQDGTYNRNGATCIISGTPISRDYLYQEGQAGRMGVMLMAIVTEGQRGRSYYSPDPEHVAIAQQAQPEWFPNGEMPDNPRWFSPPAYGMKDYADLFTPRQLVALTTFSDLVGEARQQAYTDARAAGLPDDGVPLRDGGAGALAYAEAVSVYLAFVVDRSSDFWSSLAVWANQPKNELVAHVFGRQALPMVWDYAEANPFSSSGGNWLGNMNYLIKAVEAQPIVSNSGFALQKDAAKQHPLKPVMISTDPPYYDMVGYADLSDYFYVWMRRSLRGVYPEVFGTMLVPKEPELIASSYRHGSKEAANEHFETGLHQTFINVRRFISTDYPLTVYYAFKQQDAEAIEDEDSPTPGPSPKMREGKQSAASLSLPVGERAGDRGGRASTGWETMLTSLIDSGFSIDGTWPVRSERTTGLKGHINALASSIVLVCRPRPADAPSTSRRQFVEALRRELPTALRDMQSGNIAPVDLAQASIGPGMAIYSRYSKVLEADGSPMSVRTALGLINQELDAYLAEQDGDIDGDTRFAVAWFEQFGFNEGEFGQADVLARAKNTSVAGVEASGLVVSGRGKVRLVHWTEYDPANSPHPKSLPQNEGGTSPLPSSWGKGPGDGGWDPAQDKRPTVWEATHHLIERLNSHGETGSALLMQKMPSDMAAEARQLAYRLYSICERKGWADHARDYNALVISWSGIGEEAARLREASQRGDRTEQLGLGGEFDNG